MHALEQALETFFEQAARRSATLLTRIAAEPRFTVEPDRWCFTLPDLHAFLQREHAAFREVDYARFRRALFKTAVNKTAKARGAEITIVDNRGKVDRSRYALVWKDGVK